MSSNAMHYQKKHMYSKTVKENMHLLQSWYRKLQFLCILIITIRFYVGKNCNKTVYWRYIFLKAIKFNFENCSVKNKKQMNVFCNYTENYTEIHIPMCFRMGLLFGTTNVLLYDRRQKISASIAFVAWILSFLFYRLYFLEENVTKVLTILLFRSERQPLYIRNLN